MNNIAEEIYDLVNTTGKSAPDMTKALKNIGDGDMQQGIKKLSDFFSATAKEIGLERGLKLGEQRGWIKGSLTTLGILSLAAGGVYIKEKYAAFKRKKALEQEGQVILAAIKETIPSATETTTTDISDSERDNNTSE